MDYVRKGSWAFHLYPQFNEVENGVFLERLYNFKLMFVTCILIVFSFCIFSGAADGTTEIGISFLRTYTWQYYIRRNEKEADHTKVQLDSCEWRQTHWFVIQCGVGPAQGSSYSHLSLVCGIWLVDLNLTPRDFLRVLRFFSLHKNQFSRQNLRERDRHVDTFGEFTAALLS